MTIGLAVVIVLLAALIVPVIVAETRRSRPRRQPVARPVQKPKPAASKPPLRLVVSRSEMDRELAALLARDPKKTGEREE